MCWDLTLNCLVYGRELPSSSSSLPLPSHSLPDIFSNTVSSFLNHFWSQIRQRALSISLSDVTEQSNIWQLSDLNVRPQTGSGEPAGWKHDHTCEHLTPLLALLYFNLWIPAADICFSTNHRTTEADRDTSF